MRTTYSLLVAGVMLSSVIGSANAQTLGGFYSGMAFNGIVSNQTAITQASIGRSLARGVQIEAIRPNNLSPTPSRAESARLNFSSSAATRRRNYAQFVAKSRAADPVGAANLEANLQGDPIASMAPQLAQYGLSISNVADAYAVYWVEAWQAVHGVSGESSREVAQAVKQQAANGLLATPDFIQASEAQKQELADALLVQALMIGAAREQASGNKGQLTRIASAVEQGAQAIGLDLRSMTLTEQGFVPAKETGATGPAPGASREALAAAAPAGSGPGYGLLAAAGGAGLGAAFLIGRAMGRRG